MKKYKIFNKIGLAICLTLGLVDVYKRQISYRIHSRNSGQSVR